MLKATTKSCTTQTRRPFVVSRTGREFMKPRWKRFFVAFKFSAATLLCENAGREFNLLKRRKRIEREETRCGDVVDAFSSVYTEFRYTCGWCVRVTSLLIDFNCVSLLRDLTGNRVCTIVCRKTSLAHLAISTFSQCLCNSESASDAFIWRSNYFRIRRSSSIDDRCLLQFCASIERR